MLFPNNKSRLFYFYFLIILNCVNFSFCLIKDFKICVPEQHMKDCKQMLEVSAASLGNTKLTCIGGRDRVDCIHQIQKKVADFSYMDPEDMFIVSKKFDSNFIIFKEVRNKNEVGNEYEYQTVAILKSDVKIKTLQGMKGVAKACHTLMGDTAGYTIPYTKLKKIGILNTQYDDTLSPRENELKAFNEIYPKACIAGPWHSDPKVNEALKKKYPNLCGMCENIAKCADTDINSGYEGSLHCLTKSGGDLTWTKLSNVKKYFGLAPYTEAMTDKGTERFFYLCPDGKQIPLGQPPCTWASHPWSAFVANDRIQSDTKDLANLRNAISELVKVGESKNADWLHKILGIDANHTAVDVKKTKNPKQYLQDANYEDVIARVIKPLKPIRWCVTTQEGMSKCLAFKEAAFSRNIRPQFECSREKSTKVCLKNIQKGDADVLAVDATEAVLARQDMNLKPILKEVYGKEKDLYAVAVVKKNSKAKSLEDLRGLKSCHTAYLRSTGWVAPLYNLLEKNLIKKDSCPYPKALSEFFSGGSCVPNINDDEKDAPDTLNKACPKHATRLVYNPLECLKAGDGDVAFIKHVKVNQAVEEGLFKADDIEYICAKGGRASITKAAECNLGIVPPHMVVTSNTKSNVEVENIRNAILKASELFSSKPEIFQLYGSFMGKPDAMFLNPATGVESLPDQPTPLETSYANTMLSKVMYCSDLKSKKKP